MSNTDIRSKAIVITLDKERNLKFDLNAFCELEEKFGSIDESIAALTDGKMKSIRTILWAGLVHEDEGLTEKEVGGMISVGGATELAGTITQAILEGLPQAKNQVPNPRTNRKTVK